jgi:hypothetical protein
MKYLVILSLLFLACKKASSPNSGNNSKVEYEVKITGASSWSINYLDATDALTIAQSETSTDWTISFANQVPSARYLQVQVMSITPVDPNSTVSAIATIYVNGSMVKSDTASGYVGNFILPLTQYLLQ